MPTLARFGPYRVAVYPNDHRPDHVHVIGPDGVAVFFLHCHAGPVSIREVRGAMALREAARLAHELNVRLSKLCAGWERIHGRI